MKKIYYFLAFIAVATAFSACNPLDKTYKQLGDLPAPTGNPQSFNLTLAASDYALLPATNYAQKSLNFKVKDDAAASIPTILASKYPNYANKSSANVTYALPSGNVKVADSLFTNVAYTVTNADYYTVLAPTAKYLEFTTAQAEQFLSQKYAPVKANQLSLLTYLYFESGITPAAVTTTDTYIYINGAWVKGYTLTPAQYASVGFPYNDFAKADVPNLPKYFNAILKADIGLTAKATVNQVVYVSFKYYDGSNFQRVMAFTFNGTDWVTSAPSASLSFVKTNGAWAADNTVTYSLVTADYTTIANLPNASANASAIDNLKQHGNFSISGGTAWADAEINAGIVVILKAKYATAVKDQKFVVTYSAYNGANLSVTKTFQYDGTTFVYKP